MILFLVMLFAGILSLVGSLFLARSTWRLDVAPFGRQTRVFPILVHPERYARPGRLREIRLLAGLGAALLVGAVLVLVYKALSDFA